MTFKVFGDDLLAITDEGESHPICQAVYVTRVITDFETGKKTTIACIHDRVGGKTPFEINLGLSPHALVASLRNHGLRFTGDGDSVLALFDYIIDSAGDAEQELVYQKLGFQTIPDSNERFFCAHRPIGLDDPLKAKAYYCYPEKTAPHGTFQGWRKAIRTGVLGRPTMELALAFAGLAPVSSILRAEDIVPDVPLLSLIGQSSSGKTGALRIIASCYGRPTINTGIIRNLHSTEAAFYALMGGNYGFPILLDETTSAVDWDFSSKVYTLPNGADRWRCNSSGKPVEPVTFSGAIFLSGERSLFDQTIKTGGLRARLLEFSLPWTSGKSHAEYLEKELLANYGHAVVPMIKWILRNTDWLKQRYYQLYSELTDSLGNGDGVANRILKIHAQILLSAEVVSNSLQFQLDLNAMRKLLAKQLHQQKSKSASVKEVYESYLEHIVSNLSHYHQGSAATAAANTWGVIGQHKGKDVAWIPENTFKKQIACFTNDEFAKVKKEMLDKGYLYRDAQRHSRFPIKIGGVTVHCHVLVLAPSTMTKTKNMIMKKSQASALLSA